MSLTSDVAKAAASRGWKPRPSRELQRFQNSVFDRLRRRGKPILVLAPLANVTGTCCGSVEELQRCRTPSLTFRSCTAFSGLVDASFRKVIARYGKPDVMYTEFVSTGGLIRGASKLMSDLLYSTEERPIVAQLFGSDPAEMYDCVIKVKRMGFDGVDINMGCPDRTVCRQGCGAGLIDRPELAQAIIGAAQLAAEEDHGFEDMRFVTPQLSPDSAEISPSLEKLLDPRHHDPHLPPTIVSPKSEIFQSTKIYDGLLQRAPIRRRPFSVSVKTRIGSAKETIDEWIPKVLEMHPDAMTVHFRTRKEQSLVPAHWTDEVVGKTVDWVKNRFGHETLVMGNGDVRTPEEALQKIDRWGLDGVMIGRGIYGNPFLFSKASNGLPAPQQRLNALLEHHLLYEELLGDVKPMAIMKKHYKAYVVGFQDCKIHRGRLMDAKTTDEVVVIIKDLIQQLNEGRLAIRTNPEDFQLPTPDPSLMENEPDDVLT